MPKLVVDWRPLRVNRDFRLLIVGQLVSLLGTNVTMVAVPYQVFRETHSSLWVGFASFIQLPFLIAGALYGGAFGDRYDKRALLIASTVASALLSLGLALNALVAGHHFAVLVGLAALAALAAGFTGPIRSAAIPTLLGEDQLVAGYSLYQIIINVASVAGPALAGVLLAVVSLPSCYFVDAVTFVVLVGATALMGALPASNALVPAKLWHAIVEGVAYVRQHAVAKAVYLADLNAMVFGLPRALFPAMALTVYHGGPRTLGLLYAAAGVGAVLMAFFSGWVEKVRRRGRMVVLAVATYGAAMAALGLVHYLWFGLFALGVAGAMDVISTILRNTILQLAISDEFRSRISSIQMSVVQGGPRLGDMEAGVVAGLTSTEFAIVSGGLACIAGVALLAWRRRFFWTDVAE